MARRQNKISSQLSPAVFYNTSELHAINEIKNYIQSPKFPCVGAKGALSQSAVTFRVYDELAGEAGAASLHFDLMEYVASLSPDDPRIQSFVAIFKTTDGSSEIEFEDKLFRQLSYLVDESDSLSLKWNAEVSSDPENPHFSTSIAGHPFFIVGMHPNSSRAARRTPYPVLVFNSNLQFNRLREDGRYDRLKKIIRERELEINGSINPMLDDFGRSSEARQYSGRKLEESWKCPFHSKVANTETKK
ncbi:guanitoxin biosynthesis heme-dependent pre-guanitoxin N-hydroxylase GntA [Litorimonas haliclonae]|uniref:guanitoxin biosynthesis heme-dependent pre-guanitoxin N-hydroxylase GntA n=1 Tax=Litorimonas haliclonae TaxID=2081977 RepID=UPI0039EE91C8